MRAIYGLSILNYDFICILDRNMRVFPHGVTAVPALGSQAPIPGVLNVPRLYSQENTRITIHFVYFRKPWVGHFPRELLR